VLIRTNDMRFNKEKAIAAIGEKTDIHIVLDVTKWAPAKGNDNKAQTSKEDAESMQTAG